MEAVMSIVNTARNKVGEVATKSVTAILDVTANGISTLSSMVKGEKKLIIKIENSK